MPPEKEDNLRPKLIVIAGPNGAGKTTLTQRALAHEWLGGCEYVNPDEIAQTMYGDWNDQRAIIRAAKEASRRRLLCLEQGKSLAFETVFSTREKLDFVRSAAASGFFVRLFFVGTDDPTINAKRVAARVMEGGHDVPIAKIISRYGKSVANLARAIPFVDRAYVYDNSIEEQMPSLLFRTVDGSLEKTYETGHEWAALVATKVGLADGRDVWADEPQSGLNPTNIKESASPSPGPSDP